MSPAVPLDFLQPIRQAKTSYAIRPISGITKSSTVAEFITGSVIDFRQIALRNGAQVVHINPQAVDTGSPREHGLQGAAGVLLPQLVRAAFAG